MARRRLPTLASLSAFEAAARHGSFKDAADELAVTPTSISHQVKALEDQLGLRLFDRFNRRVELTRDGRELAAALTESFDLMDHAVRRLRGEGGETRRLVVVGNPGLLDCWLRARLHRLRETHPGLALELIPSDDTERHLIDGADLALHFGRPPGRGYRSRLLCRTHGFPVCTPDIAVSLSHPSDLLGAVLLHEASLDWWRHWLWDAGCHAGGRALQGPVFHSSALVIESAVAGDGVALGDELIAGDHLVAGRLVKPFAHVLSSDAAVHAVWSGPRELSDREAALLDWIDQELQAFGPVMATLRSSEPYVST